MFIKLVRKALQGILWLMYYFWGYNLTEWGFPLQYALNRWQLQRSLKKLLLSIWLENVANFSSAF